MEINIIIDNNLKKIRQEKELTLDEPAGITRVSKGMPSQIEKGTTNPIMNTTWEVSNGFNAPYTYLLEDDYVKENPMVKKTGTVAQHSGDHSYRVFNYYSDNQKRDFELFRFELDSGKKYQAIGHSKHSVEYVVIIQGTLALEVGDQRYLPPKDAAMYFDTNQVHTYINEGTEQVQAVVTNYYM